MSPAEWQSADRKSFISGQQDLNQFFYKIAGCYPANASACRRHRGGKLP
jgi:hypothetical protein